MSDETRERVLRIGREEFNGASADETVRRLVEEHWRSSAVAAVQRYRDSDPKGWAAHLAEADDRAAADAPIGDEWVGERRGE